MATLKLFAYQNGGRGSQRYKDVKDATATNGVAHFGHPDLPPIVGSNIHLAKKFASWGGWAYYKTVSHHKQQWGGYM